MLPMVNWVPVRLAATGFSRNGSGNAHSDPSNQTIFLSDAEADSFVLVAVVVPAAADGGLPPCKTDEFHRVRIWGLVLYRYIYHAEQTNDLPFQYLPC